MNITREKESGFEIVRQYYNLVDEHYRTKKQVQDYADMLHKSPKTLSNIFSTCKLPSPLRVIHERVEAEAKRLLLYSNKSAKEIADILGFEDQASFSRFFDFLQHRLNLFVHYELACEIIFARYRFRSRSRTPGREYLSFATVLTYFKNERSMVS